MLSFLINTSFQGRNSLRFLLCRVTHLFEKEEPKVRIPHILHVNRLGKSCLANQMKAERFNCLDKAFLAPNVFTLEAASHFGNLEFEKYRENTQSWPFFFKQRLLSTINSLQFVPISAKQ